MPQLNVQYDNLLELAARMHFDVLFFSDLQLQANVTGVACVTWDCAHSAWYVRHLGWWHADPTHPNPLGHDLLAEGVARHIAQWLSCTAPPEEDDGMQTGLKAAGKPATSHE